MFLSKWQIKFIKIWQKFFLTLKSSAKTNFNLKKIKLLESHKNSYEFETEIDEENEEDDMYIDCDRCGNSHLLDVECDCAKIITKVVESPIEFQKEIEKIRKVCIEMEEKDIEYIKWTDYFISKGFKAKINFNLEISLSTFKFMITNKNNKLPIEINFIEGKFVGWIKTK
jgi:hypothetical protein